MNFTPQQWLIAVVGMLGALSGVSGQMITLFGQTVATDIASASAILVAVLAVPLSMMSGQVAQVKAVAAMPGVDRIAVNEQANPVLASVAVDPGQKKVGAVTPEVRATLQSIAKG